MFDPTQIDLTALPSVMMDRRCELPQCPGVYFAVAADGAVLYIGKARNIFNRWLGHHRLIDLKRADGVFISWLEIDGDLDEIEHSCIEHFRPVLNGSDVSPNTRGKKTFSLRISDELMSRLADIAEIEYRTLSAQAEHFLKQAIEGYVPEEWPARV